MLADPSLAGWDGFGLAVQAYQKRAGAVIDLARRRWRSGSTAADGAAGEGRLLGHRGEARPGARARRLSGLHPQGDDGPQLHGLRCSSCWRRGRGSIRSSRTHNALTVATVIEEAGGVEGYEFQRLHGMGEVLYEKLLEDLPDAACRVYAPVGSHRELLAYLVRRLLENGANSSFVAAGGRSQGADRANPEAPGRPGSPRLSRRAIRHHPAAARSLPAVAAEFLGRRVRRPQCARGASERARRGRTKDVQAVPLVDGKVAGGVTRTVLSPIDRTAVGAVTEATPRPRPRRWLRRERASAAWNRNAGRAPRRDPGTCR